MLGLAIAIGLILLVFNAVLGPMDTRQTLTLIQRFAYFGVIAFFAVPICFCSILCTLYVMRNRRLMHLTLAMTVMGSIVVAPCTAVSLTTYALFQGGRFPEEPVLAIYLFGLLMFACATGMIYYVLQLRLRHTMPGDAEAGVGPAGSPSGQDDSQSAIARVPVLGTSASDSQDAARHEVPVGTAAVAEPAISVAPDAADESTRGEQQEDEARAARLRMPAETGRDVVYVHVSGHYVEVVTTAGKGVLLMRLSDVAETLAGQGMQTHRSYWAAYRHVVRLQRDEHRLILHLTGGHKVPVGRSFRDAVRDFMRNRNSRDPASSAVH